MKNDNVTLYRLLADAYAGIGGFADGGYLRKHPRESSEKYQMRQELAYYLNYLKPCVDAHVSPIFKAQAVREYSGIGAEAWGRFLEKVDFAGTGIKGLMKRAAIASKLFGVSFIVMDRAQDIAGAVTLQGLLDDRQLLPYAFVVEPLRVQEIEVDKFGRLTKLVYTEADPDNEFTPAVRTLTVDGWHLKSSKGELSGKWNLGMLPVIPLVSKECDPSIPLPPSDFISIAQTSLAIYNMSSWLSEILVDQTFSLLVFPSNGSDDLTIGTSNALGFPPESSHMPGFIAPPADPANILAANIDRLQQEIYRMASVVNVAGVRVQASGTAKAWDFEQTNQILSDFADNIESAESRLADLFKRWTGVDFVYSVSYPSDYSIADIETELANAEVAKGLGFGDSFDVEIFKRVLTAYLPELKDDTFDMLVDDYKQAQEEGKLDAAHTPPGQGAE